MDLFSLLYLKPPIHAVTQTLQETKVSVSVNVTLPVSCLKMSQDSNPASWVSETSVIPSAVWINWHYSDVRAHSIISRQLKHTI